MVSISTVIIEKNKRRVHQSSLKFIIATFQYIGYWLNWQVFCSNESSGDQVLRSRTLVSDMNVVMKWKTRVSWNTLFYDSITFWLSAVSEPSPLRLLEISLTYFSYFVLVSDLMMAASKMQISLCFGGQICATSLHIPSVLWFCVLNLCGFAHNSSQRWLVPLVQGVTYVLPLKKCSCTKLCWSCIFWVWLFRAAIVMDVFVKLRFL